MNLKKLFVFVLFMSMNVNAFAFIKPNPGGLGKLFNITSEMPTSRRFVSNPTKPWPTNTWFGKIYLNNTAKDIILYPLRVRYTTNGYNLDVKGIGTYSGSPIYAKYYMTETSGLMIGAKDHTFSDPKLKSYSDWAITAVCESGSNQIETTFVRGGLFTYNFFSFSLDPELKGISKVYDKDKNEITNGNSITSNRVFVISSSNQSYGVFAPDGTIFTRTSSGLEITFDASYTTKEQRYLSIALIDDTSTSTTLIDRMNNDFYPRAYNFVDDTKATYKVENMQVETTFKYSFKQPANKPSGLVDNETIFLILPHHWRNLSEGTIDTTKIFNTLRGKMKVIKGNQFKTKLNFNGTLPFLSNEVDSTSKSKLATYINNDKNYNPGEGTLNTYRRGKFVAKAANLLPIFHFADKTSERKTVQNNLKKELTEWYEGKNSKSFNYDDVWGGIIGKPYTGGGDNFYYQQYCDHHFHHGYFAYASAILSLFDSDFADSSQYKGIVDLIIADYANYDRDSNTFPYFRNFDPYMGHCYANGQGLNADGNDQESSSESMNAWAAMILWGKITNNTDMVNAGIYGYATECSAICEYYFDTTGENYSGLSYPYNMISMLMDGKISYELFWTPVNFHIGIRCIEILPLTPSMLYLGYDTVYAKKYYDDMEDLAYSKGNLDYWKTIRLRFKSLFDGASAKSDYDTYPSFTGNSVDEGDSHTYSYYFVNFFKELGQVSANEYYADTPFFTVMKKDDTYNYLAYNNDTSTKTVTFKYFGSNIKKGEMKVPPKTLVRTSDFNNLVYYSLPTYIFSYETSNWKLQINGEESKFSGDAKINITQETTPVNPKPDEYMYVENTCFKMAISDGYIVSPIASNFEIKLSTPSKNDLRLAQIDNNGNVINLLPSPIGEKISFNLTQDGLGKYILVRSLTNPSKELKPYAYPSPYIPNKIGKKVITFANIKKGDEIKIYNILGEKVFETKVSNDDTYEWNVKNNSGRNIASGVYVYTIVRNGKVFTKAKIAIER